MIINNNATYLIAFGVIRYLPRIFLILSAHCDDWFCLLKILWHLLNAQRLITLKAQSFSASRISTVAIKFNVCAAHLWCLGNCISNESSTLSPLLRISVMFTVLNTSSFSVSSMLQLLLSLSLVLYTLN